MTENTDVVPNDIRDLFEGEALSSQPEEVIGEAYNKLSPAQKARFEKIVETFRVEYGEDVDMVRLSIAALTTVLFTTVMSHFGDIVAGDDISQMRKAEVEAYEFVRKLYNDNVSNVLKHAGKGNHESNFLKDYNKFIMERHPDGTIRIEGRPRKKLSLPTMDVEGEVKEEEDDSTEVA